MGCSSTKLVQSWGDPGYTGKPLRRILVLGVMQDDLQRRFYEDAFVKRISRDGVVGIAGYTLMPNRDDYNEQEDIRKAVQQSGADAALIATLVKAEQVERHVPPSVDYVPYFGIGYGFYDYWGMSHRAVYSPGYTTTDTIVKLETTVFATDSQKMIWAGVTESFNPSSQERLVNENADLIIKSMKKADIM
jgi:hypothetical protein